MGLENIDLNLLWQDYAVPWSIKLTLAVLIFIVGKWIVKFVVKVVRKVLTKSGIDPMLINFTASIANALLLLFVVVAALSQLGVDTSSLIVLIGAAGLAISLALQNSLQNFAAGVMIIVFKPFKVGDFIQTSSVTGVVEQVNIFSSTLRTGDNKEIIVPNGAIYSAAITNYSARSTRRVDKVFGIGYDSDIKLAKTILERIVSEDERILQDPKPVIAISELGASSVDFIVRPWVNSGDYWAVSWDLNEKVFEAFGEANINIPYPQMDVHLHQKGE